LETLSAPAVTRACILDDRVPRGDRGQGFASAAPVADQPGPHERILDPRAGVEIPAVAGPARASSRFMVGQVGARARVVGLLRFPGDDPTLDVDFPRARTGAVHPVGGAHDLVRRPALAVGILPLSALIGGNAMPFRELASLTAKVGQAVQEMAHCELPL